MPFQSKLYPGEQIDATPTPLKVRGYVQRDMRAMPYGSQPHVKEYSGPLIPRSEWDDRIEQLEKDKSRLSEIAMAGGIPSKHQGNTNFCWYHSVIGPIEALREANGLPYLNLSVASGAAPCQGFRNQGGWSTMAAEYNAEHGNCTVDLWPENAINRKYYTEEAKANALLHRLCEFDDLHSRDFDELGSYLLSGGAAGGGYNRIGHAVGLFDLVKVGNGYGIRWRQSYGDSQGIKGFSIWTEKLATPDDVVGIRVSRPSVK